MTYIRHQAKLIIFKEEDSVVEGKEKEGILFARHNH